MTVAALKFDDASSGPHRRFELEQAVLGALMNGAELDGVAAELFADPLHLVLYGAVEDVAAEGAVTPLLVIDRLLELRQLEAVGGRETIKQFCADNIPTPGVLHCVAKLAELARRARMAELGEQLTQLARAGDDIAPVLRDLRAIEQESEQRVVIARKPLDWRALASRTPPPREWAIDHWLGMGYVTLLAGAPGTGKTLLAQSLGASLALGRGYVDSASCARRVLMWAGEDDEAELWRRELTIAQWLGAPLESLADSHIVHSYDAEDIELAGLVDQRRLVASPMLDELAAQIGDYRADVVVLDSTARVYAGNENDRYQVTRFIGMLNRAARPTNAAVVLLAHPAKAAGSEFSGTTAWEASVRARLYLGRTLPDAEIDHDEPAGDDSLRYLCRRKANYSARDWRRVVYRDGVMVPEEPAAPGEQRTSPLYAQTIVRAAVRKLAEMGEHGSASTASPNYLPKLAKQYGLLDQTTTREFADAMRALRKDGTLVVKVVGKYHNRTPREGLVLAAEVHK